MSLFGPPEPNPANIVRPAIGTFNVLESSIGMRGMGKSTHQCYRALQLSRQVGGAYVIGHSLGARLPSKLPSSLGGETLPITYHTTIAKLERGIRRHPDRWHILSPPLHGEGHRREDYENPDTADDLLKFATSFSTAIRKSAWQRQNPFKFWKPTVDYQGIPAVPIIVIVDEGIAIEAAGPSRKESNKWFLQLLYSLRHLHIGMFWAIQDASARSWRVLEQSSAIHVFRIRHQWAKESIRAAGASQDELDRISALPPHEHVTLSWDAVDRDGNRMATLDDETVRQKAEAAYQREKHTPE